MMLSIKTSEIKTAKYNPKNRTDKIGALVKSIKECGIIVPLIVDADNNLIDGHRRLASAKVLKIDKVPAVKMDSKISKERAFEIVNTNSKKISNRDFIYIHLNGGIVPTRAKQRIAQLEEIVGEAGLKNLSTKDVSVSIIDDAIRVRRYCGEKDNDTFLKKTIFWMADNRMQYIVKRAMEVNIKKEAISRAIAVGRPLKLKYE